MPRDHYISQVYLRMFRANKKNQIFVCEKGTGGTSSLASIEDVAQEVDFYSKHTNNKFSGIESRAKKWLDKLKNHKNQPSITSDEKKEIAEFVALMYRRVPAGYERMRNIAQEPEKYFMAIESNAPYLHSKLEEMRQALRFMPDELKSDFPKPLWDLSLDPDNYLPLLIIEVLRKMTWRFYVSDNPAFFTSDNPAFLDNIAPPYGFVRFPMSSHIALEANWQVGPDLERFQATESKIMEIDSWVIGGATRNIYHSGNVDWVLQRFDI